LHFGVAPAPAWALIAAAAGRPLEFFNFEDLLRLWCTLRLRVVDFIYTTLVVKNLFHLLFRDETTMVPEAVLCEIFPAGVSYVVFVHPLLLFLPVLKNSDSAFLGAERRSLDGPGAITALTPTAA
jgi:hypothetical protein